jgi:hypothetical protein
MVHELKFGEKRKVWPTPGRKVHMAPDSDYLLPESGAEVVWNEWWHNRALDGSLCLTDPTGKDGYRPGVHATQPPALALRDESEAALVPPLAPITK